MRMLNRSGGSTNKSLITREITKSWTRAMSLNLLCVRYGLAGAVVAA
jgi:hypothetical protein